MKTYLSTFPPIRSIVGRPQTYLNGRLYPIMQTKLSPKAYESVFLPETTHQRVPHIDSDSNSIESRIDEFRSGSENSVTIFCIILLIGALALSAAAQRRITPVDNPDKKRGAPVVPEAVDTVAGGRPASVVETTDLAMLRIIHLIDLIAKHSAALLRSKIRD